MAQHNSQSSRVYAFDALRAFAVLSVLYLHCTLSFTLPIWVGVQDVSASGPARAVLRETYELLHAFVLPVFFLMSGFLTRRLCVRDGAAGMLRNRCQHVLLPLLIGCLTLVPVVHALRWIGQARADRTGCIPWSQIAQSLMRGDVWRHSGPHYLWFLSYLMIFCVLTVLLRRSVRTRIGSAACAALRVDRVVAFCCRSHWAPLALTIPTLVAVMFVRGPIIAEVGWSFVPQPALVVMYWLYFLFGWLLHRTERHLEDLARGWKANLAGGLMVWLIGTSILLAVHSEATDFRIPGPGAGKGRNCLASDTASPIVAVPPSAEGPRLAPPPAFPVYQFMKVYLSWALTLGTVGLAVQVCTRRQPLVRYLADSSYWIYLAHVPVLMAVQIIVADWPLPWWMKLPLTALVVLALLLLVYQYAIKSNWASVLVGSLVRYLHPQHELLSERQAEAASVGGLTRGEQLQRERLLAGLGQR